MKIASILTGFSSGGAETLAKNLSLEFVRRGHECHIVALAEAAELGNCIDYAERFKADLGSAGIGFTVLGGATRRNPVLGGIRLRRALAEIRPDVLHIHTGQALLFQALAGLRLPTVYTHHNIRLNFPAVLFRLFDRFVDRYVAIGTACEELLRAHVRKSVRLVVNGVPEGFAVTRRRKALPPEPTVLSVGALTRQKDYPTLVEAAALCVARLEPHGRSIRFRIAGGGPERQRIQRAIDSRRLGQHVELLGTRTDIPELMANSDLLVNSSLFEGLPIALIEAAMSGLPAVATAVGGTAEVVLHGKTGYLVPPGRPDLLAQRIGDLIEDEELYLAFSAEAKARSSRFALQHCVDAHLALDAEVVREKREACG